MTVRPPLVLSLYLNWSGFGYVFFEKPLTPYDWGVRQGRGKDKHQEIVGGIRKLIELYRPYVVVLEDWENRHALRAPRIEAQYQAIVAVCAELSVPVERVPMAEVWRSFDEQGATTKHEIAQKVAKHIPALTLRYRVPVRKIWQPERQSQALFDAAAIALTFFQRSMR